MHRLYEKRPVMLLEELEAFMPAGSLRTLKIAIENFDFTAALEALLRLENR